MWKENTLEQHIKLPFNKVKSEIIQPTSSIDIMEG